MNEIRLKCYKEPLNEKGDKVMNFTKNKTYIGFEDSEGGFHVLDDNDHGQHFFDVLVIFKVIN